MPGNPTVEIVDSSVDKSKSSSSSAGSEPTPLMRGGSNKNIVTDKYPEVTTNVNIDGSDPIEDVMQQNFRVFEEGDERDIISLELIAEALDMVFVFDDTGSMSDEIEGAKRGVNDLIKAIDTKGIDSRYGLVTFKNSAEEVEVDCRLNGDVDRIKSAVNTLTASGGGPAPEANFDAIEQALDLDWRRDAQQVIVDITDAPSHYRGDGVEGTSNYTFDEVAKDLNSSGVTFISVSPNKKNRKDSIKSLTAEVGGLWTDISSVRGGYSSSDRGFKTVLDRISSLLASTYVLTHFSCIPPGEKYEIRIEFDHPSGQGSDTAMLEVPNHFELPPECPESEKTTAMAESTDETPSGVSRGSSSDEIHVSTAASCPECGTTNDPEDTFCKECGQRLD